MIRIFFFPEFSPDQTEDAEQMYIILNMMFMLWLKVLVTSYFYNAFLKDYIGNIFTK